MGGGGGGLEPTHIENTFLNGLSKVFWMNSDANKKEHFPDVLFPVGWIIQQTC